MQTHTTRRDALFQAMAGVAAIGLASCAAQPALAGPTRAGEWDAALRAYRTAKAEEDAFDAYHDAISDSWTAAVEREADRLADARGDAEDRLMDIPSPTAAAFAAKCLVAHGGGRETDCWNTMLEAEATRFALEA